MVPLETRERGEQWVLLVMSVLRDWMGHRVYLVHRVKKENLE